MGGGNGAKSHKAKLKAQEKANKGPVRGGDAHARGGGRGRGRGEENDGKGRETLRPSDAAAAAAAAATRWVVERRHGRCAAVACVSGR